MNDDLLRIYLTIDKERYPLRVKAEEEAVYRAAGKLVEKTLQKYRNLFPEETENGHWTLTALELAYVNQSIEQRNDTAPYTQKLQQLMVDIERCIDSSQERTAVE